MNQLHQPRQTDSDTILAHDFVHLHAFDIILSFFTNNTKVAKIVKMPSPLRQQIRSIKKGSSSTSSSSTPSILWALRFFSFLTFGAVALLLVLMIRIGDDDTTAMLSSSVTTTKTLITPQQQQQPVAKATIAYAISLVKCGDKQSNSAGLVDAA